MAAPPQQFCVRWNSYQSNLQNAFPKLLNSEHFVDVTLACENEQLKCHKVVLSACSTYFEKLLLENPCKHPIIFMKDMKFQEMQSLVDFMYKGEVNVTQDDLPSLLKSAEALQIRGLCGSDQLLNQQNLGYLKTQPKSPNPQSEKPAQGASPPKQAEQVNRINSVKKEENKDSILNECGLNPSSSECDSSDIPQSKDEADEGKEEVGEDDSYYDNDTDLMDSEYCDDDGNMSGTDMKPEFAIANVSCQYEGSPSEVMNNSDMKQDFAIANVSCQYDGSPGATNRRIRRSDEELRRAAECITRGQTFQTVSDQFNIPISTIRFYMARKGILPRRKRGRACATPVGTPVTPAYSAPGNTSPIGPPYHIVHYKLPPLGVSKLK